ncbi:MAG: 30S ribosomal protein S6 [Clostridiales bacterium]|nr:30S ribosomal protein S6 [Clostridiales bacterium]
MSQPSKSEKKKSISKNRLLPWLVFVSLLLVIATAVLIVLIRNHAEASKGSDYPLAANAVSGFDCDYSEAQRIYPFGDGLLKVTATRTVYMSVSGKEIYSVDTIMEDPICVIRGDYAFVADVGGFSYACFGNTGMIYSGSVNGKIGYAELSNDGCGALVIEEENTNGAVIVFDGSGQSIAQWNSVESGYPVSVCFSPKSTLLSIALIDTDGSHMQPNLKQIAIPESSTGERPYDYSFVSSDESQILPILSCVNEERVMWAGVSCIYSLDLGELKEVPNIFPNIISVTSVGGKTGLFYSEGVGQQILFSSIDSNLITSSPIVLGNHLKAYSSYEKEILIAVDDKLILFDADASAIKEERKIDEDVIRVLLSSKNRAVIVTSSGIREIRF